MPLLALRNAHCGVSEAPQRGGGGGGAARVSAGAAATAARPRQKAAAAEARRASHASAAQQEQQRTPALDVAACSGRLMEALMESFEAQQQGTRLKRDEWEARARPAVP